MGRNLFELLFDLVIAFYRFNRSRMLRYSGLDERARICLVMDDEKTLITEEQNAWDNWVKYTQKIALPPFK